MESGRPNRLRVFSKLAFLTILCVLSLGSLIFSYKTQFPADPRRYGGISPEGYGGMRLEGWGFPAPFADSCYGETITIYGKKTTPPTLLENRWYRPQLKRAIGMNCTFPTDNTTRIRVLISHGFLDIAYCKVVPFTSVVPQRLSDWWLFDFYSGYALHPLELESHPAHGLPSDPRPPEPILLGDGVAIHLLTVALIFGSYPALVLIRGPLRRLHRRFRGKCVHCAYDLTGNISGTCPECGIKMEPRIENIQENPS